MIYLMFTFIERHVIVCHYTDKRSRNDQRHVTAFRPISEAAHSWSYDNTRAPSCDIFHLGFIMFQCPVTTVHHLYNDTFSSR